MTPGMKLDLEYIDTIEQIDLTIIKNQEEMLYRLKAMASPVLLKMIAMRLKIWDDEQYDTFAVQLCQLIQPIEQGENLLKLLSKDYLIEQRIAIWILLV